MTMVYETPRMMPSPDSTLEPLERRGEFPLPSVAIDDTDDNDDGHAGDGGDTEYEPPVSELASDDAAEEERGRAVLPSCSVTAQGGSARDPLYQPCAQFVGRQTRQRTNQKQPNTTKE